MLGAQRRIEARIGQLFGKPEKGGRGKTSRHDERFNDSQRNFFRLLARALANECELTGDEWRKSRCALVSLVRGTGPGKDSPSRPRRGSIGVSATDGR